MLNELFAISLSLLVFRNSNVNQFDNHRPGLKEHVASNHISIKLTNVCNPAGNILIYNINVWVCLNEQIYRWSFKIG